MSGEEIWISDVLELTTEGECVKAVLASGKKRIVLRGSRHTLVKVHVLAGLALKPPRKAKVVPLPRH